MKIFRNLNKSDLLAANFDYQGDGSGPLCLRIARDGLLQSGRFAGSIDNLIIRKGKSSK